MLHTWPVGHGAFGPQAGAWQMPLRQTPPLGHCAFEVQVLLHWPFMHSAQLPFTHV